MKVFCETGLSFNKEGLSPASVREVLGERFLSWGRSFVRAVFCFMRMVFREGGLS